MRRFFASAIPSIDRHTIRVWILIVVAVTSLIYGAVDLVQGLQARLLWPISVAALILGWLLARSRIQGRWAAIIGLLGGIGFVFWQVGRLAAPFLRLLQNLYAYLSLAIEERAFPETLDLQNAGRAVLLGIQVLFDRLYLWFSSIFVGEPSYDPIVLAMVWGLAIWGMTMWMSWAIRRRDQPFAGSLPAFLVLGYSLSFVGGNALFLLPMLGSILLLAIFVGHDSREREWKRSGEKFPKKLRRNVTWTAIIIIAPLVTMAAFTPSISLDDINDFYRELTQDQETQIQESLGLNPESAGGTLAVRQSNRLTDSREGGLPRQHLIGSGPELSEQVVMVISATELQPQSSGNVIELPKSESGYYWRSLTYDRFDGRGWYTFDINIEYYQPGELAFTSSLPGQHLLRQQVNLVDENSGLVYVAGNLIRANQPFSVGWRPEQSSAAIQDMFGATIDSSSYVADSLLPIFSQEELRAADQSYPEGISEQYLRLPDIISDRVLSLAFDLTATLPTAYDRAVAIESYLRTFEYDLDIPLPPLGLDIDIVDYFLFTLQRGYCDYYASSMVVLARAAGLPARFVEGYIGGTYDAENDVYIITEDQAHSWVEIYFPNYGWVEFEPTAGRAALDRPATPLPLLPSELAVEAGFLEPIEDVLPLLLQPEADLWEVWLPVARNALIALVVLALIWPFVEIWGLWLFSPRFVISNVYARLDRYGRYLEIPSQAGKTPYEFGYMFSQKFVSLLKQRRPTKFLNAAERDIDWLTAQFAYFRYSPHQPGSTVKSRFIRAWRRLRSSMWAARWEAWRLRLRRDEDEEE